MDNTTDGTWDTLPVQLNEGILQTLEELKFTHMTPVQVTPAPPPPSHVTPTSSSPQHLYSPSSLLCVSSPRVSRCSWATRMWLRRRWVHVLHLQQVLEYLSELLVLHFTVSISCHLPTCKLGPSQRRLLVSLQVTGSGKTLAFVIPIIELLLKREEKLKKMQVTMRETCSFTLVLLHSQLTCHVTFQGDAEFWFVFFRRLAP